MYSFTSLSTTFSHFSTWFSRKLKPGFSSSWRILIVFLQNSTSLWFDTWSILILALKYEKLVLSGIHGLPSKFVGLLYNGDGAYDISGVCFIIFIALETLCWMLRVLLYKGVEYFYVATLIWELNPAKLSSSGIHGLPPIFEGLLYNGDGSNDRFSFFCLTIWITH